MAADVEILGEEEPHRALAVSLVVDRDLAQVEVLVEINCVLADQPQGQIGMVELDMGDQRVADVVQVALPAIIAHPAQLIIDPDAEAEGMPLRVVLLADVRPVEVAQ